MTRRLLREAQTATLELSAAMQSLAHATRDNDEAIDAFIEWRAGLHGKMSATDGHRQESSGEPFRAFPPSLARRCCNPGHFRRLRRSRDPARSALDWAQAYCPARNWE
jgi:hypothetical protein